MFAEQQLEVISCEPTWLQSLEASLRRTEFGGPVGGKSREKMKKITSFQFFLVSKSFLFFFLWKIIYFFLSSLHFLSPSFYLLISFIPSFYLFISFIPSFYLFISFIPSFYLFISFIPSFSFSLSTLTTNLSSDGREGLLPLQLLCTTSFCKRRHD